MDNRDKLKEKIAEAIYPATVMTTEFEAVPFNEAMERPRHYGLRHRVLKAAEAALAAIEAAGFAIIPEAPSGGVLIGKTLHHLTDVGGDDLCQGSPGIKGETVSREGAHQSDGWPSTDKDYVRGEGRRAYGNQYDHDECPDIYKNNGMAVHWLEGWVDGHRERSDRPKADLGYCLCGTVWNIEAIAKHAYPHGTCPDCGKKAELIERAALSLLEEPAIAGDTESAASDEASLTPPEKGTDNG